MTELMSGDLSWEVVGGEVESRLHIQTACGDRGMVICHGEVRGEVTYLKA